MKLSFANRIAIRSVVLVLAVAAMPAVMYYFNGLKDIVATEERALRSVQAGVLETSEYIRSGISSRLESAAVNSSKAAIEVDNRLADLGAGGADLRKEFEEYFVAMVAVNSLFLENRVSEGEIRLDQLAKIAQKMDKDILAKIAATDAERDRIIAVGRTAKIGALLVIIAALLWVGAACLPSASKR